jgi:hypothetical protein
MMLPGCAAVGGFVEKYLYDQNHLLTAKECPWHTGPGLVGVVLVGFPIMLVLLPVYLVETVVEHEPVRGGHQATFVFAETVAGVAGSAVALPFFVVGSPLEFVDWHQDRPQPVESEGPNSKQAEVLRRRSQNCRTCHS